MMTVKPKLVAFVPNPRTLRDVLRLASPRLEVLVQHSAKDALQALKAVGPGAVLVAEHTKEPHPANTAGRGADVCQLFQQAAADASDSHRVVLGDAGELLSLIPLQHSGAVHFVVATPMVAREFLSAILVDPVDRQCLESPPTAQREAAAMPVPVTRVYRAPKTQRAQVYGGTTPRR